METVIRVGVLMGGKSDEHDVSLMSAVSVMKHLDRSKFSLAPIGISRQGHWIDLMAAWQQMGESFFDEAALEALIVKADPESTQQALQGFCRDLDVVFPVLHGPFGEDGTIQGLCEMLDVPYVGANVTASALCMDKSHAKRILKDAGLPVVPWIDLFRTTYQGCEALCHEQIEAALRYPLFIKPANLGSSVGISKAKNREELEKAIELAFRFDRKILVEQGVPCRELECAILGNELPEASCVGEIIPAHEFYDYEAKYFCDGESKMLIPAELEQETAERVQSYALQAYRLLGIFGLSRVDFFLDKETGQVLLNEINTMPGFTKYSMYPTLWAQSGLPYKELLERLIGLALENRGIS